MNYLILSLLLLSCSSAPVSTSKLENKHLVGMWKSTQGSSFNYMQVKCNGDFTFKTFDHEDKATKISKIKKNSFETSPQFISHYYEVVQWPFPNNDFTIRLKYITNSILEEMSSKLSKLHAEQSKEVYTFKRVKRFQCP